MVLMWLEWYKKVLEIVYDMLIYMFLLYKFGNLMMNLYIFIFLKKSIIILILKLNRLEVLKKWNF